MNKSDFVASSKFSFSSGGGASVAGDSENDDVFVLNCDSVFGDATGGWPGVAPVAVAVAAVGNPAADVAAAVIDAGMPASVAAFVAAATAACFKRSILCVCGCLWGLCWGSLCGGCRLVGLLFDSYYIIHII